MPGARPELGTVEQERIDDRHPLQLRHRFQQPRHIGSGQQRVEPERDETFEAPLMRFVPDRQPRRVAVLLAQVLVAELVGGRRVVSEPCLELRYEELWIIAPVIHRVRHERPRRRRGQMILKRGLFGRRHPQVTRQNAGHDRVVRGTLDVRVPAQGVDAAARSADVAQQQLQDRPGADDLAAHCVHRPANRIHDRADAIRPARRADDVGHLEELFLGAAGNLRHHRGRIAFVVVLEELEHAARVLKRRVATHETIGAHLVAPRGLVVAARRLVEPREQPIFEPEVAADDE